MLELNTIMNPMINHKSSEHDEFLMPFHSMYICQNSVVHGHDEAVFVVVVHLHDEVIFSVVIFGHNEAVFVVVVHGHKRTQGHFCRSSTFTR